MTIKNQLLTFLLGSLSILMVGCGGGSSDSSSTASPPKFSQLVVFGDSLSDSGAYKVGTVDAVGGGRFTVNSPSAKVWVENVAQSLGFSNSCTAETGLPNVYSSAVAAGFNGAALTQYASCTNYAQGAARVSNPYGIDSYAVQQVLFALGQPNSVIESAAPLGKMATPVSDQMTKHLSRNPGGYTGKELVIVFVGANDLFMNLNAVGDAATGGSQAALSAKFAGWSDTIQYQLATNADPTQRTNIALMAGTEFMSGAATTLLDNVKSQLINKGAKNIVVINVPDVGSAPAFFSNPQSAGLARALLKVFNDKLAADIKSLPNVLFVDAFAESQRQAANPAQYGLSNITDMACAVGVPPNNLFLNKSSLGCSSATVIPGDISHYLYADSVHPTPYGHQLLSNYFLTALAASNLGK